jgi:hypothetical protein
MPAVIRRRDIGDEGQVKPRSPRGDVDLALKLGVRAGRVWLMATHLGLEPCWGKLDARNLRGGAGNVAMRAGLRPTAKAVATPPDATAGAPALYPTIVRMVSESPGRNASEREMTPKHHPRRPSGQSPREGNTGRRSLADAAARSGGAGSDSTVTRMRQATGETLLVPRRNPRSQGGRITGAPGKSADGERVADGPGVARKRGNARRAKGPCCSARPPTTWEAGAA